MLLLATLLLAACAPVEYAPGYDPYMQLGLSEFQAEQARLSIRSTEHAAIQQGQQAAAVSTRIAAEVLGTAQALSARQTEVSLAATQIAPTQAAATTSMEAVLRATDTMLTQTPVAATTQALAYAIEVQRAQGQRAQALAWVVPAAILIVALGVAMGLAWSFREWTNWRISKDQILTAIRETRTGPYIYDYNVRVWMPAGDAALTRRLVSGLSEVPAVPVVELSPGGVTATSRPAAAANALALVQAAVERAGGDARSIPSWRVLGWTSERWQAATSELRDAGLVEVVDRRGTFVKQYDCLADLLFAMETRQA